MLTTIKTTCPYCGVGCGVDVTLDPVISDQDIKVRGDKTHPANLGKLCSKGSALGETLGIEGRLLRPRVDGEIVAWDAALDRVANGFSEVIRAHGPDAVAFYVSGQLLSEDYYIANKLMKGFIGSGNIDTNSRLCMSSSVAGHKRAFGSDTVPGCYEDLELADLVILTGSNLAWCHPVIYQRLVKAKRARPGMRVVVIDPRETASCDIADLHLALNTGTDGILFSGLLVWLHQRGLANAGFVRDATHGFDEALRMAGFYAPSPIAVAEHCGLPVAAVERLYTWFGETEKTVTVYSQGINQSSSGTDKVNAIINCHLLTGRIGRPGMGPFSITGQPNAMGGREVGALANQLACHMDFERDDHVELVERFWRAPNMARRAGLKAVDLFRRMEAGEIKAVWIMATNPAVSLPDVNQVRRALRRCELVVVSDCVENDTTGHANVLLPAQTWGEKDGTVTNSERRISRQRRFASPPGEAQADWWIVQQVARRMGFDGFDYAGPADIFREYAALSGFENGGERDFDIAALAALDDAAYAAMAPLQWPLRSATLGVKRLFANGRFFTPSKRANFVAITPRPPGNLTSRDYPLVLNTGRVRDQWHTMTRTGRSPRLSGHVTEPYAELHPDDAFRLGIHDAELVQANSRWGEAILRARVSPHQHPGHVFVPMHWNDQFASAGRVGALVNAVLDPISGQPEFKHTPVRVVPYRPEWHGFLLTRCDLKPEHATYWTRARRQGLWHYELAGEEAPGDWASCARNMLCSARGEAEWSEMFDSAANHYRAARIIDGRLESCIFIGPDYRLPPRDWLVQLFAKDKLDQQERMRILAGTPGKGQEDIGPVVCSCFGVGRNTLEKAIRAGVDTPEALGEKLQAGTNCGSCVPELRVLIEEIKAAGA